MDKDVSKIGKQSFPRSRQFTGGLTLRFKLLPAFPPNPLCAQVRSRPWTAPSNGPKTCYAFPESFLPLKLFKIFQALRDSKMLLRKGDLLVQRYKCYPRESFLAI